MEKDLPEGALEPGQLASAPMRAQGPAYKIFGDYTAYLEGQSDGTAKVVGLTDDYDFNLRPPGARKDLKSELQTFAGGVLAAGFGPEGATTPVRTCYSAKE